MSDTQIRGYILTSAYDFLREGVGDDRAADLVRSIPDHQLYREAKDVGWYPSDHLNALSRIIVATIAGGDEERTRKTFVDLGQFTARIAINTFLRLVIRVLNPGLMAKRFPQVWSRDFSRGQASVTLQERKLLFQLKDVQGVEHCGLVAMGYTTFLLTCMGKQDVHAGALSGWSLQTPAPETLSFEVSWR
jgi:hypothetical protein